MAKNEKVVILAGAPPSASLDWTGPGLLNDLEAPIARFASRGNSTRNSNGASSSSGNGNGTSNGSRPSADRVVWRSIPLQKAHHHEPAAGQCYYFNRPARRDSKGRIHFYTMSPDQSFVALATASSDAGQSDRLLSQFYDQSLAAHDDVSSSQLVAALSQETTATATNGTSSFRSTAGGTDDGDSSVGLASRPIPAALGSDRLTELKDLPSAASLAGAAPQTVTVNLIVGIISVAAPKTVRTRWGSSRSLVEVLVGDDTRSGFGVTFWLPPSGPHAFEQSVVAGLRPLDVVLIRNVALHVFMNKVYGSSLRKDLTKIHLLHRRRLDAADFGGHYDSAHIEAAASDPACAAAHPQLDKTSRVRVWLLRFVGCESAPTTAEGGNAEGGNAPAQRPWDVPPPHDTQ